MPRKAISDRQKKHNVQERNRCKLCKHPRGYLRKFAMCRKCFREEARKGNITGVVKASW